MTKKKSVDTCPKNLSKSRNFLYQLVTKYKTWQTIEGTQSIDIVDVDVVVVQTSFCGEVITSQKKDLVEITTPSGVKNFEIKDVKYI